MTVGLSGLGGDELFSGYPTHVAVNLLARMDRAPRFLTRAIHDAASIAPWYRGRRLAELSAMDPDERAWGHLLHQTTASHCPPLKP